MQDMVGKEVNNLLPDEEWNKYLEQFAEKVQQPLEVKLMM